MLNFILQKSPVIHLKLEKKVEEEKKVKWEEGTVDNEFMNKKKSKCTVATQNCIIICSYVVCIL